MRQRASANAREGLRAKYPLRKLRRRRRRFRRGHAIRHGGRRRRRRHGVPRGFLLILKVKKPLDQRRGRLEISRGGRRRRMIDFSPDEGPGISRRARKINGRRATPAEAEAIEGDQQGMGR